MEDSVRGAVAAMAADRSASMAVKIGPLTVALDFTTAGMQCVFGSAFAPGCAAPEPDYRLGVGAGSCGTAPPALVPADRAGDMLVANGPTTYALWTGRFGASLHAVDRVARRAGYWTVDAASVPAWERSRPFLPAFQAMLHGTGWVAVHAAGIARHGRGVLLAGVGGAGKTSLALAALQAGWHFLGDDFVVLRTDAPMVVAPLYATARLRDDMAAQFPGLMAFRHEISADGGETRHELQLGRTGRLGGATLAAIVLVDRRGGTEPRLDPVSRTAVIAALSATTSVATPGGAAERLDKLMRLTRDVTPLRFDPGPSPGRALDCLADLIA